MSPHEEKEMGVLRGKKDQEEVGKKRPKIVGHGLTQPVGPTRPTCTESKTRIFLFISHHLIHLYSTHIFHNALFIGKFQLA